VQAENPVVSNVRASQRAGTKLVRRGVPNAVLAINNVGLPPNLWVNE